MKGITLRYLCDLSGTAGPGPHHLVSIASRATYLMCARASSNKQAANQAFTLRSIAKLYATLIERSLCVLANGINVSSTVSKLDGHMLLCYARGFQEAYGRFSSFATMGPMSLISICLQSSGLAESSRPCACCMLTRPDTVACDLQVAGFAVEKSLREEWLARGLL